MRQFWHGLVVVMCFAIFGCMPDQSDEVKKSQSVGRLEVIEALPSQFVEPRKISVWLPPGYDESDQHYPVLYMHDGQNVFEAETSYIGEEWGVDEAVARLSADGKMPAAIVVGVWNTEKRWHEYMPEKIFERLPVAMQEGAMRNGGAPHSDEYLRYLTEEVKVHIDHAYRTLPGPENTAVMGSSMGGLISFYAATEYPAVFGAAAALSIHWPLIDIPEDEGRQAERVESVIDAYSDYLAESLPPAGRQRYYFDHGTEHLDAHYAPYQKRIDQLLSGQGLVEGSDWLSREFPGAAHNEMAWRERIDIPLSFLFDQAVDSAQAAAVRPLNPDRPIEDEIIYFVMPDRFADGDAANNTGGIVGGADDHGYDPTHKGYYHGGDIQGLIDRLDYIQGLGVSAIWFTPIFKNKAVQGADPYRSAGYHGYWITDFTQIDPHLGSNQDFRDFVDAAHARGMKVIMDIVTNHTADVIQYRECVQGDDQTGPLDTDCSYRSVADYPYTTRGDKSGGPINPGFMGDAPEHQNNENFAKLTDPGFAYTPFVPEAEATIKVPAWLNDPIYYHNRGNTQWEGESNLYGDFATLDDLFTEHPRVLAGMIDIFKGWISEFKVDGFRIDTAKHVNDSFWQGFVPEIMDHAHDLGIEHFYVFGEVYAFEPEYLSRFTREVGFPAILDFAFQSAVREVIVDNKGPERLRQLFDQDHFYDSQPRGAAILPTFLGNHDMGRLGHFLLAEYGQDAAGGMLLKRAELAHAMMMFTRGVPVIYYGDEQGFSGHGHDQDARQDMFPSRVDSYNDNRLIGTAASTRDNNYDTNHPLYKAIAAMAKVYHAEAGLRRGRQVIHLADKKPGIFAFSRKDEEGGKDYLVVLNTAMESREAVISSVGNTWRQLIGDGPERLMVEDGQVRISLSALSYAVYRNVGLQ